MPLIFENWLNTYPKGDKLLVELKNVFKEGTDFFIGGCILPF